MYVFFVGFMTHCGFGYVPFRYIYIHIHCKYICIYVYIYICIYVYVYIYIPATNFPQFPLSKSHKKNSALAPDIGVKRVAQGTYGTVFRGTLRDGTEVAIKARSRLDGWKKWVGRLLKMRY
jgi:hypothetical protein